MKSNPLEPCNAVTLLDFLFLLEEDYEARPWLANKSWLPESLKYKFTHSVEMTFTFLPFTSFSVFDFESVYTFFVSH